MKIDVRFRGLAPSPTLREHARRKVLGQLGRFAAELSSVQLRVADENGPKGGLDKRCQAIVSGRRIGVCTLEMRSADFYSAVDLAVEKMSATVARTVERVRRGWRRRPAVLPGN